MNNDVATLEGGEPAQVPMSFEDETQEIDPMRIDLKMEVNFGG